MKFRDAQKKAVERFESTTFLTRIEDEDVTMLKYLPHLQQINKLGFITVDSQAGTHTKTSKYEIVERAYLSGFMVEKEAIAFIKTIGIHTDKNAIYVPVGVDSPSSLDIPLTITKHTKDIQVTTHMSTTLPKSVEDSYKKIVHLSKSEKAVFIFCWDPKWSRLASGKEGLFTDIIKSLQSPL